MLLRRPCRLSTVWPAVVAVAASIGSTGVVTFWLNRLRHLFPMTRADSFRVSYPWFWTSIYVIWILFLLNLSLSTCVFVRQAIGVINNLRFSKLVLFCLKKKKRTWEVFWLFGWNFHSGSGTRNAPFSYHPYYCCCSCCCWNICPVCHSLALFQIAFELHFRVACLSNCNCIRFQIVLSGSLAVSSLSDYGIQL